ncbi:Mur ligase family protein [Helicobacter cappadocius]|uniref:Mur ligase family protein n=1 Tax=Helicobacter cappadocius TaxID=3063998 RepID=A0AA90PZA6_9HELI|nr:MULTISPECIES: Mur ligase family protein [unclassified Helicobacter]MDO7253423.1 Mur ligase family protein [Helicobacter sp. faydin-H75]MDP2539313.1 Mur ligase family protein [Helicobacter sp. faydin-H76]
MGIIQATKNASTKRSLEEFLQSKGVEYAPFDPDRAKNIYAKLSNYFHISSKNIHIVGTNGKGSTGRFIALGLLQAGYKVLHFTSPHLFDFNERYYKNGAIVSDLALQQTHEFLQQFDFIGDCSYFEYATFLACVLAQDVDFLVLEAGLGGEYDSTTCLPRDISVFTAIGLDHQEILGEHIEEIATTKLNSMAPIAFLAKQSFPVIKEIAIKIAHKKNSKLHFVSSTKEGVFYSKKHSLPGFLTDNFDNAMNVLNYLNISPDIQKFPPLDIAGRCQKIAPNITLDVGHNEQAARELLKVFSNKKVILVYNTYRQKDVKSILKTLKPIVEKILIIEVQNERIIETDKLKSLIATLDIDFGIFEASKIEKEREYLVFGSFSVVKQFLEESGAR